MFAKRMSLLTGADAQLFTIHGRVPNPVRTGGATHRSPRECIGGCGSGPGRGAALPDGSVPPRLSTGDTTRLIKAA
jgi:hypothetical protein